MVFFSICLINLLWIFYSLTEGTKEGFYWHYENQNKKVCNFDINPIFNLQRLLVICLLTSIMTPLVGLYSLVLSIGMVLQFSYFHNGTYYYTRNKLGGKIYEKGWKDESKSFPRFTLLVKYKIRTISMILGICLEIFTCLFLIK